MFNACRSHAETSTKSVKNSTLYHNIPIRYYRDFFIILHWATRESPCVSVRPGSFLIIFYEFLKQF